MNIGVPPVQYSLFDIEKILAGNKARISYQWSGYFNNLSNELISNVGENGFVFPAQEASNLDNLASLYPQSIVFNSTTNRMNVNNTGTYEEIATISSLTTSEINDIISSSVGRIFYNTDTNTLVTTLDGSSLVTLQTA